MSAAAREGKRPTLTQVAARAGVSLKTASRALNGESYVAQPTRARVLAAAEQLHFRPNITARDLRTGARSTLVGLVTGDVANPFFARIAAGAERRLRAEGLQLITASTDENPDIEHRIIDELLERQVRGLLIATGSTLGSHTELEHERRRGTPLVYVDQTPNSTSADTVGIDNRGGIRQAVAHLLERGHRRIALVGDLSRLSTHRDRAQAFADEMAAAGVPVPGRFLRTECHDTDTARHTVIDLLAHDPAPTALITTNNRISVGALHVLHGHADPPALIGFDDFELADLLAVSVIAHDATRMGAVAADLLLARLTGTSHPPRHEIIPTHLVTRGSGERTPTDTKDLWAPHDH